MSEPRFDPGGFYEFNLAEGRVQTRTGERVLMVPGNVVAPLVAAAVDHGDLTPVRRLGRQVGEHTAQSLGGAPDDLAPQIVLGHLSSILGLFGWGRLSLERWGGALVAAVADSPDLDEEHLGIAALLGGALSALTAREVACVPMAEGRFLVVDPAVAEEVWGWAKDGQSLQTIVGQLGPAANAAAGIA